MVSTKALSNTTVLNTDNNYRCYLSTKSAWFLKDHVTLQIQLCHHKN